MTSPPPPPHMHPSSPKTGSFVPVIFSFVLLRFLHWNIGDDVTPAPHMLQIHEKMVLFVCAPFVLVCAIKQIVCAASVFKILKYYLIVFFWGHSAPPHAQIHPKQAQSFVLVCAGKSFVCAASQINLCIFQMFAKGAKSHKQTNNKKSTFYFFRQHFVCKVLISNLVFRRAFKNTTIVFFSVFFVMVNKGKRNECKSIGQYAIVCFICAQIWKKGISYHVCQVFILFIYLFLLFFLFWFCKYIIKYA